MTLWKIPAANLRAAPLTTLVNALLLALGTASIVLLLLASEQFQKTLSHDARGVDLVIGAHGSPLQLVLSSVYHADVPNGNIELEQARTWAQDPRVALAIPLSLGDNYHNFRIVGTTIDYPALYSAELEQGQMWQSPMEAVIGAAVARQSGLKVGQSFIGAHGLFGSSDLHRHFPYRVVGILKPGAGVLDRLVLTSLESVWRVHGGHHHDDEHDEHDEDGTPDVDPLTDPHRQITAMLVRYATPLAATTLPREINAESGLLAAAPAFELTRLLQLVGVGIDGLRAFAGVLLLTAAFSIFAALYGALAARRHDLAMLRCLGASRRQLLLLLLLEGLLLRPGRAAQFIGHLFTDQAR